MNLLLIDDQPDILTLIIREFRKFSDTDIDVATNGTEGIIKVDNRTYDAVILDYSLPDIDGLEVLKQVNNKCNSPVIIITGNGSEEVAAEAIKLGAFDYITKSVGYIEKLPWIVNNVVMRYNLMKEKIKLEKKVEAQRDYLQAIFNDMEESVVIIDRGFNIIDANRAFLDDSGYSRDNAIGNKCYMVSHGRQIPCCPPDNSCPVSEVFESGAASQALHLHTDRHGVTRHVEISASPIRYEGCVERVIEIAKDITKKVILEQELINTNTELENKMAELEKAHKIALHAERLAAIGRLAAGVAHEINNPLTNASINIEILRNKLKDAKMDRDILKKIESVERNVDRASVIAKELLEFSRQQEAKFMPLDINNTIKGILIFLNHKLDNIKIDQHLSRLPEVAGDPVKLEQVFINIFNNSVEAMPDGGNIDIYTVQNNSCVEIRISDTGSGIPENYLSQVFDPFFTTKEIGAGTGLGLSICYGIIKMHNGSIDIQSEHGKGTLVTIKLPVFGINEKNTYS